MVGIGNTFQRQPRYPKHLANPHVRWRQATFRYNRMDPWRQTYTARKRKSGTPSWIRGINCANYIN